MSLFVHEITHFLGGLLVGTVFAKKYHNLKLILLGIASSLLIDFDHLVDLSLYSLSKGIYDHTLISKMDFFRLSGKVIVPLHSYELVFLLLVLSYMLKKWRKYLLIIFLTGLVHIIIDQLTYHPYFLEYSFIYRALNNFSISAF